MHDDQVSNPAMRTERRRWCDFGGRGREVGGRVPGVGAGRHIGFDQGSRLLTRHLSAGTGQSVIAHFGKTRREDVVHKTADKFLGAESHALKLLGPVVAIAKGDLAVRKGFQPAVGDGDAKGITGQIPENLFARSGMLAVDDPGLRPSFRRRLF